MLLVFFSSVTENTTRFIDKLGFPAVRIPLKGSDPLPEVSEPFVLITPTYGSGQKGYVPKQVIRLLNVESIRNLCTGVVGSGNMNFNEDFGKAADVISAKLQVPLLYKFELAGTDEDVRKVQEGLPKFFQSSPNTQDLEERTIVESK